MKQKSDSRKRILNAGLKEFSLRGFTGAKIENIARRARVNKAMIFYYFSNKEILYITILKKAFGHIFSQLANFGQIPMSPEIFLERFVPIHFNFLLKNMALVKIISFDLIHYPKNLPRIISEMIRDFAGTGPAVLISKINDWGKQGLIRERNPLHFMMNILSLNIFSLIGKPLIENLFSLHQLSEQEFYQQRLESIIRLLKHGMLA